MKKLIDINNEKIEKIKKQAEKKISIEKKYDNKMTVINDKKFQIMQIDCINLNSFNSNIERIKFELSVNFRLSDELIDSLIGIVSSNSVYSQKNCVSDRPACTKIHRLDI